MYGTLLLFAPTYREPLGEDRCAWCGAAFEPDGSRIYCSGACGYEAAQAANGPARVFLRVLAADPCAYCGGPGGQRDHIVPRRAGGGNEPENLTGACRSCNVRKRSKPLLTFLLERAA